MNEIFQRFICNSNSDKNGFNLMIEQRYATRRQSKMSALIILFANVGFKSINYLLSAILLNKVQIDQIRFLKGWFPNWVKK